MIIFLGIVGELATVIGSIAISLNAVFDSILEIAKNGYKIDKNMLDENQRNQVEGKKPRIDLTNRILGAILLLVPGVNLINSSMQGAKFKEAVRNDPKIKEATVPMTEKEKEQYAKMEGKLKKIAFIAFTSRKEKEEEYFGFVGKKPTVVNYGLTSIYYEKLMPLDYTLDEVKRLNEATTYSYRIGKIDGKNVAIIGIPVSNSPVSRIRFVTEYFQRTHIFEEMTEEEAQDKTFTVYPFTIHNDTIVDVENVIQEIKQSRINNATKVNSETLDDQPKFNQEIILTETEEVVSEEQKGPQLVKTKRPQNDKR